jgi:hypothetical protein
MVLLMINGHDGDGPDVDPDEGGGPRASWSVWRQDDNGNTFLVSSGHTQQDAEALRSELEARGHKQLYWVAQD